MSSEPHISSSMELPYGGKPNPHGMQLDGGAAPQDAWAVDALAFAQDIAAVLQPSRDDLQPLDDAPSYEDLCSKSSRACSAAAAAGCQVSSMTPQHLSCLSQLCSSVTQLAAAVFCEPDVALQLLAAGTYAASADQLKATVKELTNHLIKCVEAAAQPAAASAAALSPCNLQQAAHKAAAGSSILRGLVPAVQAAAQQLLHMALTLAAFISVTPPPAAAAAAGGCMAGISSNSSAGSSSQIPKEMRSMAVLNLSWANLTRLLLAVPADARIQVLDSQDILRGLQCALQQLQRSVRDLPLQAPERREVVVRFWLQSVSRLTSVVWEQAAQLAVAPLLEAMVEVYEYACYPSEEFVSVQDFLQQVLQPRLVACLAALLSCSPEDSPATHSKFQALLSFSSSRGSSSQQPAAAAAGGSNSTELLEQQKQQLLQVHLLVVLDLLQQMPNMPFEVVQEGCQQLLAWVISTAGSKLCSVLLAQEAGGALLQHVLQSCLACFVGCLPGLQQQQQQELFGVVMQLVLPQHPLVAFIAQQLLADVLSSSSTELQLQQLAGLLQLLEAAATCWAVPGAGCDAVSYGVEALVDTLVAVLQACDEATAVGWVSQNVLSSSSIDTNSSWMDASSCAVLACHCSLLLRLGTSAAAAAAAAGSQGGQGQYLEGCLSQLWLTAQQVLELLGPQQQRQQHAALLTDASACERLLVLHQLTWLLEGMQAVMQLLAAQQQGQAAAVAGQSSGQAQGQGSLMQGCAAFALDLLKAVGSSISAAPFAAQPSSSGMPPTPATPAQAVHTACIAAALKVLAAAGHVPVQEGAEEVLQLLHELAAQQQPLHALLAAVCGKLGVPAGNTSLHELFQQLFSSPHWAVRHATAEGLLLQVRHNSWPGHGIVRMLPPHMRSSNTEATPAVIDMVKAHLHRAPDPAAQQAYQDRFQQLTQQHSHALAAVLNNSSNGTAGSSSSSSLSVSSIAAALQQAQELLAACGSSNDSSADDVLGSGSGGGGPAAAAAAVAAGPVQALLQLAAAAASSLEMVDKALGQAESDVRLLMAAASSAAADHSLCPDDILLVSRQGSSLVAGCASMSSRLRNLKDSLERLKG